MWMLVWEEGLLPLTEAQVGEVAWQSPAAWASTSHPVKSHQITHSPLEALDLALLPVIAHGFDQRPINSFRVSFPSLPEAVGPSDQGKAETAKSNKHVAKEEDICSQYFSFWLAKKHFCQRRDRELKLGQTAGPKVAKASCLDVISHFWASISIDMVSVHASRIKHVSVLLKQFYFWLKGHLDSALTPKSRIETSLWNVI